MVKRYTALPEDLHPFPPPTFGSSQPLVTLTPEDPTPPSGHLRHHAHMARTDRHTHNFFLNVFNLKIGPGG